jgi:hypothetical protein
MTTTSTALDAIEADENEINIVPAEGSDGLMMDLMEFTDHGSSTSTL